MQIYDYRYRAKRLKDGKIVKGTTEAPSKSMVEKFIQDNGMKAIEVFEQKSYLGALSRISFGKVISERDLIFYLKQMSSLLRAGVKLNEASEILATQQTNKLMRRVLYGIYYDVNSGSTLADAYDQYPLDFPDILISMVRVGEKTGNLKQTITDIVVYFETQFRIKASIKQTMTMPTIYLTLAFAVSIFIFVYVMPNFETLYDDLGGDLPGVTRLFINAGDFMSANWLFILIGLFVSITAFHFGKKHSDRFQRFLASAAIRMPILGDITRLNNLSKIAATLSQLLNAHVPLQECLMTTYDILGNKIYKDIIIEAQKNVNAGDYMSKAFEGHYAVEVVFTRMLGVGERTGDLGGMLKNLSQFYDEDSTVKIDRVRKLLEPVMMVIIFAMVGVMLLAIMLPSLSFETG